MSKTLMLFAVVASAPMAFAAPPDLQFPKFTPPRIVPRYTHQSLVDRPIRITAPAPAAWRFVPGAPPAQAPQIHNCPLPPSLSNPYATTKSTPKASTAKLGSASIPVRHIDVFRAVGILKKRLAKSNYSPIIVADPGGRAIHVIAEKHRLHAIRDEIAGLDRHPSTFVFEIRVTEIRGKKPGKILCTPRVLVVNNVPARVQVVGPDNKQIEITAVVKTGDAASQTHGGCGHCSLAADSAGSRTSAGPSAVPHDRARVCGRSEAEGTRNLRTPRLRRRRSCRATDARGRTLG